MSMTTATTVETTRAASLRDAEQKANALFDEIQSTLIRPGILESQLSKEIHELGAKRHNIRTHWHKRVVRSGPNTLKPYAEEPQDRVIEEDDILFVDLGPVFEAWEADFGRTYVLGKDPVKLKLRDALEPMWRYVKTQFDEDLDMTGDKLYAIACEEARKAGWEYGGPHAGHLVGDFPHERIPQDRITQYITKGSRERMRRLGKDGNQLHWILEIHLVDRERNIGGFFEQLLTVD